MVVRGIAKMSVLETLHLLVSRNAPSQSASVSAHELAVEHVIAGRWTEAIAILQPRAETDQPTRFLLESMAAFENQPPADWDGAFRLTSK